jgi:hypothetical protein
VVGEHVVGSKPNLDCSVGAQRNAGHFQPFAKFVGRERPFVLLQPAVVFE